MPTESTTYRWVDPAAVTTPMPRVDLTLHLSARTAGWLGNHSQARKLVGSVWDMLAELERAGCPLGPIAALRRILSHHQSTPAGRCLSCRRWRWRRRRFPCIVWHQVHVELLGLFTDGDGNGVGYG